MVTTERRRAATARTLRSMVRRGADQNARDRDRRARREQLRAFAHHLTSAAALAPFLTRPVGTQVPAQLPLPVPNGASIEIGSAEQADGEGDTEPDLLAIARGLARLADWALERAAA